VEMKIASKILLIIHAVYCFCCSTIPTPRSL
jgi:hypothetical protein